MQQPFAAAAGFPVRTLIYSKVLGGVPTDFAFSGYANQSLVIVTQLGTAGTILSAATDRVLDSPSPTYTITVLTGKRDNPLLPLCARQIAEVASSAGCSKPMIICIGLREHTPALIKDVLACIKQQNIWPGAAVANGA